MNYLLDILLIEPIELNLEHEECKEYNLNITNIPDSYRKCLFNDPNFQYNTDHKKMAEITNTKEEYWSDIFDLEQRIIKLSKYIMENQNKEQYITEHILCQKLFSDKYYREYYDIMDIIITKASNKELGYFTKYINILLNQTNNIKVNYFVIRISLYLSIYFINKWCKNGNYNQFIQIVFSKINEIQLSDISWKIFTEYEKNAYHKYLSDFINHHHSKLLSNP